MIPLGALNRFDLHIRFDGKERGARQLWSIFSDGSRQELKPASERSALRARSLLGLGKRLAVCIDERRYELPWGLRGRSFRGRSLR